MTDALFEQAIAPEVPFTQAVAKKAGAPLEVVEKALSAAGVPTVDEAAVPHRLRITRVRFDGTKAGMYTGPFVFDQSFGPGLWAICTVKNDAGKTSVLEIIMWALRGRSQGSALQPDVIDWLDSVLVEATLDDEPFSVSFRLTDNVPFGALTCGGEVTPFSNDETFEGVMSEFMLRRLGFFEFTTGGGSEASAAHHGWPSCSSALYLSRSGLDVVLGDVEGGGVAQRLLLMFAGVRWGKTHVACQTAYNEEEAKAKDIDQTTTRVRNATAGTIEVRRQELEEISGLLAALPAELAADAEIAEAHEAWMRAIADHGSASGELAAARRAAKSSRQEVTAQRKRVRDNGEAALAQEIFRSLRPVACPRCSTEIGNDRREAEVHDHTCSVCDRSLVPDATVIDGVVSEEDTDEPPDEAAFADLVRQAADADAARVKDLADRVATLDGQVRDAAARVAAYRQDAGSVTERRTLELRLATTQAVIEQLETLSGGPDPSSPGGDGDKQLLAILKVAAAEAKARKGERFAQVFAEANPTIVELGHKFGFDNLQNVKLDASATMAVTKGNKPRAFRRCTDGEKLRLRIAVVVALLRVADNLGVGRHPGFLLIDSIGAEETEPKDFASFVKELGLLAEELGIQIIVASARPEILTHVPADHQIVATGDSPLW